MSTASINDICIMTDSLNAFMKDNLKESRYIHSLGVEKMAEELAAVHGADVLKAKFAGRYHDIAKCFAPEVMNSYIAKYGLSDRYLNDNALAHSKVAAEILCHEFGVSDADVLNAVRSHTTGRDGMSLLEEIIYVADAIEDNRHYDGLKELQDLARTDLDAACLFIMDYTIDSISKKGRIPDEDTLNARKFIEKRISDSK